MNAKKPTLAACKLATGPKRNGGFGIINLVNQNDALLLKNLHKFYNRMDIPWVNMIWENYYRNGDVPSPRPKGFFWWNSLLKLITTFKGISKAQVQDGRTVLLWHNLWTNSIRSSQSPKLFSFTTSKYFIVAQTSSLNNLHEIFQTPLFTEAYQQYMVLSSDLHEFHLMQDRDIWSYIWGSSTFSIQKAYQSLSGTIPTHPALKLLWKNKCQPKHRVFFWLLLQNKLNTRDRLRSRHMHLDSYNCENCILQINETAYHLFLKCNFARACWSLIGLVPPQINYPLRAVMRLKHQINI
jgi:hypothetical protein